MKSRHLCVSSSADRAFNPIFVAKKGCLGMKVSRVPAVLAIVLVAGIALAAEEAPKEHKVVRHVIDRGVQDCNELGVDVQHRIEQRWQAMCGSSALTEADLARIAKDHEEAFGPAAPILVVDTPPTGFSARQSAFNIVFNINTTNMPAGAPVAFAAAEQYLESKFSDPITVTISVAWQNLGSGVIGATGSNFVTGVSYTSIRAALVAGMDSNDVIQNSLPSGSSFPVRFDAATTTVINQTSLIATRANYNAMGLTSAGAAGNMTYNSGFSFDFDPSNGTPGTLLSLVDTVIHETTHAMGFTSSVDGGGTPMVLDLFRFARADGTSNYNPDNAAQFQTTPRLLDNGADCVSDVGTAEWRMSPGTSVSWQASHFFEQTPNIGIMDPAEANGESNYPNYYKTSDNTMMDAIGYNDTLPCIPSVTGHPSNRSALYGQNVSFTGAGSGTGLNYQWRKGTVNLPNIARYQGVTSPTLTILGVTNTDAGQYNLVISNTCGSATTNSATLTATAPCPADVDDGSGSGQPDGAVEIADLVKYLQFFEAGDLRADKDDGSGAGNLDSAVEIADLLYFLVRFEAGC